MPARFITRAERLKYDGRALDELLDDASYKARTERSALISALAELLVMIRLIRAWLWGNYRDVALSNVVLITGALMYPPTPNHVIAIRAATNADPHEQSAVCPCTVSNTGQARNKHFHGGNT